MDLDLERRLEFLEQAGVMIVDRRQTYVDENVNLNRICSGAVLYPGTRLLGELIFVGPGAKVGTEGPAVLENTVISQDTEIASGYVNGAVLLRNSKIGANAHIRGVTLFEEEASTAHAVGLKHTIVMSFVTMGSLINFCDALISGGRSRNEHSEVGSGFIHFNYTPRGQRGDKATPSLIGDVPHGVYLREPRIFLGGLSGIVGPQKVGFGSFTVAGQVIRREVGRDRIFGDVLRSVDKHVSALNEPPRRIQQLNLNYIGQLIALQTWYQQVRLPRIPKEAGYDAIRIVTMEAANLLSTCIAERKERLRYFLQERGFEFPSLTVELPRCPLQIQTASPHVDHIQWVQSLPEPDVQTGIRWLQEIVQTVVARYKDAGFETALSN